ncbi:MAG: hypothetical protein ACRC1T_09665 [Clostridium chrysemydis]|uniref:hypothetical protein n=1 Tax=Clostridium chrysemydis TaxID=2665504 RepID=UPI003F33CB10
MKKFILGMLLISNIAFGYGEKYCGRVVAIVHSQSVPRLVIVRDNGRFDSLYLDNVTLIDRDDVNLVGKKVYKVQSTGLFPEYIIKK